jgi:hypothetical protein
MKTNHVANIFLEGKKIKTRILCEKYNLQITTDHEQIGKYTNDKSLLIISIQDMIQKGLLDKNSYIQGNIMFYPETDEERTFIKKIISNPNKDMANIIYNINIKYEYENACFEYICILSRKEERIQIKDDKKKQFSLVCFFISFDTINYLWELSA